MMLAAVPDIARMLVFNLVSIASIQKPESSSWRCGYSSIAVKSPFPCVAFVTIVP